MIHQEQAKTAGGISADFASHPDEDRIRASYTLSAEEHQVKCCVVNNNTTNYQDNSSSPMKASLYHDNRLERSSLASASIDFKPAQLPSFSAAAAEADSKPNSLIYPPFLITNMKTDPIPNHEGEVTFVNGESESDKGKFLYDIQKREHDYYAKSTEDIDKIREILNGHKHHILLYMHGFREDANCALQSCSEYNSQDEAERKYLVVPILWNTVHKDRLVKELLCYNEDRTKCFTTVAPKLKEFLEKMLKDQKDWQHKYSLMCHSMGNYILRIVAQLRGVNAQGDVDPREAIFENVFMVAADVREDIFDEGLNDFDPNIYPLLHPQGKVIEIKFERENPGLDVASLAKNKVHVLWSSKDQALLLKANAKSLSFIDQLRAWLSDTDVIKIKDGKHAPSGALGRNGKRKNLHDKLKNKVVFHDCDSFSISHDNYHSYQWNETAVKIYEDAIDNV
ncbi:hypothetical protein QTG54_002132 [Skeletonema marinoi]|uniref:Alpha/beta hydrolase n=1 Tax=Skeletonema marinoi TaxID=267567 RepID=A0AAD9DIH1_9STRA|nr:hypothetical protein QTG54_002132 [Skeletonema marinoi]